MDDERCKVAVPDSVNVGFGVLEAAQSDLESGMMGRLDTLVAADIFTDFLEMATHLIENGYKDPAASLTGAVLEGGLRKIAVANSGCRPDSCRVDDWRGA